jgi:hypothetical protein
MDQPCVQKRNGSLASFLQAARWNSPFGSGTIFDSVIRSASLNTVYGSTESLTEGEHTLTMLLVAPSTTQQSTRLFVSNQAKCLPIRNQLSEGKWLVSRT